MEALTYTLNLPATRDHLWRLWATDEGLASWLCLRAHVEPVVGGAYELFWNPDPEQLHSDSTIGCQVISLSHPRLIEFTWRGSDEVAHIMNVIGAPVTQVRVEFIPTLEGTRLELNHSGWGDDQGWAEARAWFDRAWTAALERLQATFERG